MKTHLFIRATRGSETRVFKVSDRLRLRMFTLIERSGWRIVTTEIEDCTPCFVSVEERESADTTFALEVK